MNLKNDMISYPALVLVILFAGIVGASVNGLFGLILFFRFIIIVSTYLVQDH